MDLGVLLVLLATLLLERALDAAARRLERRRVRRVHGIDAPHYPVLAAGIPPRALDRSDAGSSAVERIEDCRREQGIASRVAHEGQGLRHGPFATGERHEVALRLEPSQSIEGDCRALAAKIAVSRAAATARSESSRAGSGRVAAAVSPAASSERPFRSYHFSTSFADGAFTRTAESASVIREIVARAVLKVARFDWKYASLSASASRAGSRRRSAVDVGANFLERRYLAQLPLGDDADHDALGRLHRAEDADRRVLLGPLRESHQLFGPADPRNRLRRKIEQAGLGNAVERDAEAVDGDGPAQRVGDVASARECRGLGRRAQGVALGPEVPGERTSDSSAACARTDHDSPRSARAAPPRWTRDRAKRRGSSAPGT